MLDVPASMESSLLPFLWCLPFLPCFMVPPSLEPADADMPDDALEPLPMLPLPDEPLPMLPELPLPPVPDPVEPELAPELPIPAELPVLPDCANAGSANANTAATIPFEIRIGLLPPAISLGWACQPGIRGRL